MSNKVDSSNNDLDKSDFVKVLILAKDVSVCQQTSDFLNRRGWESTVVGSVKSAIEYSIKHKPDFVLLSFSHPSGAILKLPSLLTRSFNIESIAFSEENDRKAKQKLNSCGLEHVFFEGITGPSVQLKIKKIILSKNRNVKRAAKPSSVKNGPAYMPGQEVESSIGSSNKFDLNLDSESNAKESGSGNSALYGLEDNEQKESLVLNGKSTNNLDADGSNSGFSENSQNLDSEDNTNRSNLIVPKVGSSTINNLASNFLRKGEILFNPNDMSKGVHELASSLDKGFKRICQSSSNSTKTIEEISFLDVMSVKSEAFNGYVVIAKPCKEKIDREVISDIRISFSKALKDDAIEVDLGMDFSTEINKVSFIEWASAKADFVSLRQYGDSEVAMAFFTVEKLPELKESKEVKDMLVAKVDDLTADEKITFSGYLNFEKNNKMLLYMKNGGIISEKQKARLINKEIKNIFLSKKDKNKFIWHVAAASLNGLIKSYLKSSESNKSNSKTNNKAA